MVESEQYNIENQVHDDVHMNDGDRAYTEQPEHQDLNGISDVNNADANNVEVSDVLEDVDTSGEIEVQDVAQTPVVQHQDELQPAASDSPETEESDLEIFEKYLDGDTDFKPPRQGEFRQGVIVELRSNEILVNIGVKRDGIVPSSDLSRLESDLVDNLSEGQDIDVVVARPPDDDGQLILSIADALQEKDWMEAERLLGTGEITKHAVLGYNKGGLTVDFNHIRGFVPASHLIDMPRNLNEDQRRVELEKRIGQEMILKVIEVERRRRRLVMSQMLAEREYRTHRKEELFRTLQVGDVVNGEVRSIRPFGAFVDIGGADGLLHVSEIGWTPIGHPREALGIGQAVEVEVIRLDPENNRIALSRKRLLSNPWDGVEERYHIGDDMPATITRIVDFGAFAELESGVEGLIHISELADIAVVEPLNTIQVGDKVQARVLRVDQRRRRVGLSIRQATKLVDEE